MKKLARKKVVLLIVEGPSDQDSLELIFDKLFPNDKIMVCVMHCDITTERKNNPSNIVDAVTKRVKEYAGKYGGLKAGHFQEIIHLIDTDGSFIPDDHIIHDSEVKTPIYTLSEIRTNNCSGIISRNNQKQSNINKLLTISHIWRIIPYRLFYFSCNLEHVLHNQNNVTDEEKEQLAHLFVKKYKDNPEGFKSYISNSDFSICDGYDYKSGWEYIKQDLNSLNRYTNLGLCFKE